MKEETERKIKLIIERTHDKIYLEEDRKDTPKEYFKFTYQKMQVDLDFSKVKSFCDIGCATGDFLYYISQQLIAYDIQYWGVDVNNNLLERSKQEVGKAIFRNADIFTGANLPFDQKFDVITMFGVHGIFDSFEPWVQNILCMLSNNGKAYVFGLFNPINLDVLIKSKASSSYDNLKRNDEERWESGWNLFSQTSILNYLKTLGVHGEFSKFSIGIEIPRQQDPLRSWTEKMADGSYIIQNGLQLIHPFYLLTLSVD